MLMYKDNVSDMSVLWSSAGLCSPQITRLRIRMTQRLFLQPTLAGWIQREKKRSQVWSKSFPFNVLVTTIDLDSERKRGDERQKPGRRAGPGSLSTKVSLAKYHQCCLSKFRRAFFFLSYRKRCSAKCARKKVTYTTFHNSTSLYRTIPNCAFSD